MTLEDSIHTQRLRVLRDAERLGNAREACRRHGLSRTVFYRLRRRLKLYGPDGVHPKRRGTQRGRPSALTVQTERRIVASPWRGRPAARSGSVTSSRAKA